MKWLLHVDKLVMEMLANHTPPSCIQSNLLAMARAINAKQEIIKEIPCHKHIQNLCTVLLLQSKTIAAKEVGQSKKLKNFHFDGTSNAKFKMFLLEF